MKEIRRIQKRLRKLLRRRRSKILLGLVFLAVIVLLFLSCGNKVHNKSPEAVVTSLINAYQGQDQRVVKECYGLNGKKACAEEVQKEIDYNMNLFKAREAKGVSFEKIESIGEAKNCKLVYVWYNFEIKSKRETQKAPTLSFYYVKEKENGYCVVPAKDITEEMSEASKVEYENFTKTEDYKKYEKAYRDFIRKNPKYENSLQNNFKALSKRKSFAEEGEQTA